MDLSIASTRSWIGFVALVRESLSRRAEASAPLIRGGIPRTPPDPDTALGRYLGGIEAKGRGERARSRAAERPEKRRSDRDALRALLPMLSRNTRRARARVRGKREAESRYPVIIVFAGQLNPVLRGTQGARALILTSEGSQHGRCENVNMPDISNVDDRPSRGHFLSFLSTNDRVRFVLAGRKIS